MVILHENQLELLRASEARHITYLSESRIAYFE
jgi:hypothetical protein